jgi:rhamnogalacturonan endolyase
MNGESKKKVKSNYNAFRSVMSIVLVLTFVIFTSFTNEITANAATAALSVSDDGTNITVDTGAGLVYKIKKSTGAMMSAQLNGEELIGDMTNGSRINYTLPNVTYTNSGSQVLITCKSSDNTVTQYYASKAGDNTVYMATYTTAEASTGELYFVFSGNNSVLTDVPAYSDIRSNTGTVDSISDAYGFANGHTASKYYGNDQAKDLAVRGVTGNGVGVFMAYGNRETSIGGPFQRDVQFLTTSADTEIYNYMNSTHAQTDVVSTNTKTSNGPTTTYTYRTGLFGPYALCFTGGSTPSVPDFTWMSGLGLQGYVSDSNRGSVTLAGLDGMDSKYTYTIGLANSTAQYWESASSTGAATITGVKPGTYTLTVYKGELEVAIKNITVTAGNTTSVDKISIGTRSITANSDGSITTTIGDPSKVPAVWRIGDWDGTPLEFDNGKNIQYMNPYDSRNDSWGTNYTVGDSYSNFPAAQFRNVNNPIKITFNISGNELNTDHRLEIGITTAYKYGYPATVTLTKPDGTTYVPSARPKIANDATPEPSNPTITYGTYRGYNQTFVYDIAKGNFTTAGTYTITLANSTVGTGSKYNISSYAFDCIQLDGTPDNAATGITVPASSITVVKGSQQQFTATVSGTGTFDSGINWSLITTTGAAVNTKIDSNGLLAVDANETLSSLTVRATSKADKNIYADIKVKLVKPFEHALNYDLTHATVKDVDINTDVVTTGAAVTVTFAPEAGYKLPDTVDVDIDGVDSPDYDYDSKIGVLKVENVIGDLTIGVTGESIVETIGASNVGQNGGTLKGTVNAGNEAVLDQGFEWRTTSGGSYNKLPGTLNGENLTADLTNLYLYTSYTFRAYAKTATGTGYGEEETFRTEKGSSSTKSMGSSGGGSSSSSGSSTLASAVSNNTDSADDTGSTGTSVAVTSGNASGDTSNSSGQVGWQLGTDNKWYHLSNSTGIKDTGWVQTENNNWYYLNKSTGEMETGWVQTENSNWFYLDKSSGAMKTGWIQTEDSKWYYLDTASGTMKTGWVEVGGKWYYLTSSGALAVNTTIDGYIVNGNGEWVK